VQAQIIETNLKIAPHRHLMQILFFIISMVVLLYFMNEYIFPSYPLLGFFTVLFFVFHPVHTEVVANIKSRDEILSLLFITLTGIYSFRYMEKHTTKNFILSLVFFVAALLSKEYAIVFPFVLIAGMIILRNYTLKELLNPCFNAMFAILLFFAVIRFSVFNNSPSTSGGVKDVLNDPYLFATTSQEWASRISIILQYFRVLLYPADLSYDYSYNHYPYMNFSDWQPWASILLYVLLGTITIYLFRKRHIIGFALIFFLSFFVLVNNLFFNIGATMGERLIYHSSLGFCMIVVWSFYMLIEKIKAGTVVRGIVTVLLCLCILYPLGAKTIRRNRAWQSDYVLNTTDVYTVPGSALANSNAGSVIFNRAVKSWLENQSKTKADSVLFRKYADTSIGYFKKAIEIHPNYLNSHMNLGLCYYYLGDMKLAAAYWEKAAGIYNGPHPTLQSYSRYFLNRGLKQGSKKNFSHASIELRRAAKVYPYDAEIWENLGGALFMTGKFKEAQQAFSRSLELNPSLTNSQQGRAVAINFVALQEKITKDSSNKSAWLEAASIYKQNNLLPLAEDAYTHVLKLDKGNAQVRKELEAIKKLR
jgi:protein O-mannosyl-transferase